VIHRPDRPDEIISANAFRRRARQIKEEDADLAQPETGSSDHGGDLAAEPPTPV
jgi:hypothetical protein